MARTDLARWGAAAVVAVAALTVACSPKGGSEPVFRIEPPAADNAFVRFIDGSPDSSPQGGSISIVARSGQFVGTVSYRQASPFVNFTRALTADLIITSASWPGALTCMTPFALQPGTYYTIVVAGSANGSGNQRLQCQVFSENFTSSAQPTLLFHHASPATYLAGQQNLLAGTFSPAQGTFGPGGTATISQPIASATFVTILTGANPATQTVVAGQVAPVTFGASGAGGIGFYVVPSSAPTPTPNASATPGPPTPMPTPEATILPAQAQLGAGNQGSLPDPANAFPIASSTVFSIYVLDAPAGTAPPFVLLGLID